MTNEITQYKNEYYSFYYQISSSLKRSIRFSIKRSNSSLFKFGESALKQIAATKNSDKINPYYYQFNKYDIIGKIIQNYFIKLSKYIFGGFDSEGFYCPERSVIIFNEYNNILVFNFINNKDTSSIIGNSGILLKLLTSNTSSLRLPYKNKFYEDFVSKNFNDIIIYNSHYKFQKIVYSIIKERVEKYKSTSNNKEIYLLSEQDIEDKENLLNYNSTLYNLLIKINKDFPHINNEINDMLDMKVKDIIFPEYVFLPINLWKKVLHRAQNANNKKEICENDVACYAAICTWIYSKTIYKFNEDLLNALMSTELDSSMPVSVLTRLPEYCFFIETTNFQLSAQQKIIGFFIFLNYDIHTFEKSIFIILLSENTSMFLINIPLEENLTFNENIIKSYSNKFNTKVLSTFENVYLYITFIKNIISLIVYLCSKNPDIDLPKHNNINNSPYRIPILKNNILFPAKKHTVYHVGNSIGDLIHNEVLVSSIDNTTANRRVHVRRGHWHGYWVGPKNRKQTFIVKWLYPILVGKRKDK